MCLGFWICQGSEYTRVLNMPWVLNIRFLNMTLLLNIPSQQTFQRCFDVVFWLIWRRDEGQPQINVETTLCISTLEFTTLNNVESTLCVSTLTWTTLNNVEKTLSFQRRVSQRWSTSKQRCEIDPFRKEQKKLFQIEYNQSFNCYFIVVFTLLPILWGICWRILAKPQKLRSWNIQHCNNLI